MLRAFMDLPRPYAVAFVLISTLGMYLSISQVFLTKIYRGCNRLLLDNNREVAKARGNFTTFVPLLGSMMGVQEQCVLYLV